MKIVILTTILLIFFQISKSQIIINEICASNFRNYYDEDNDDSDWIELYNTSDQPVNLKNWKIFDKNEIENAFVLPDTIIQAKGRLVIFASGKNRYTSNKLYVETTGMGVSSHIKDEIFHFKYIPYDSNFDVELKIDKVNSTRFFAGAGIMFKEHLDTKSNYASIQSNEFRESYSAYLKKEPNEFPIFYQSLFNSYPNQKVRMKKTENIIEFYVLSFDHYTWYPIGKDTLKFNSGYLGVCFAAADYTNTDRDNFLVSNLIINGENIAFESLESTDISYGNLNTITYQNNEIHTNFSLNRNSDFIYLWDNKNELIDKLGYTKQMTNLTFSRYPDGNSKLVFATPTPKSSNTYSYDSIIPPPYFSENSIVGKSISKIEIYHDIPDVEIYYTLDGTEPNKSSFFYQNQITLDTSVVIRAKAFLENAISENDVAFTYLPDEKTKLSVMSLILDKNILYDKEDGLFLDDNVYNNYELPICFNYFYNEIDKVYSSNAGLKLHGQASRLYKQKSFRIYSRSIYNNDVFDFPFWGSIAEPKSERLILRNGGQDRVFTFVRDYFANILAEHSFKNIDYNASKILISYLNEAYYGIHILKERFDKNFIAEKYNINSSSVNIIKDDRILDNGNAEDYILNYNSVMNEIDLDKSFQMFQSKFDLKSFCEYTLMEFFSAEEDWPINNQLVWSSKEFDNKWRWHINDFDLSFDYPFSHSSADKVMLDYVKIKGGKYSDLLLKMLENKSFINTIGNIFADKLNTTLNPIYTNKLLDSIAQLIRPELDRHNAIYENNLGEFEYRLEHIHNFLEQRPQFMFINASQMFNQSGTSEITLSQNIKNAGIFHLNSIDIYDSTWTGKYFNEIPINISVKSNPGYQFIGWENTESKDSVLTGINILELNKFNAIFKQIGNPIDPKSNQLVINEIMYKPADNMKCEDWIELYNNSSGNLDLSFLTLKDKNDENSFTIPENTILKNNDYLIIAQDIGEFRSYYGLAENVIGGFDFGFGEDDAVRIFDYNNNLIDEVYYSNKSPWDTGADNTGRSLELLHPNYDNSLPWNWKASETYSGTPLEENSQLITKVENKNEKVLVYPNPVEDYLTINLSNLSNSKIIIYDIIGNEVLSLKTNQSSINIDFNEYLSGFYVINIYNSNDDLISTSKFIKK